MTEAAVLLVLHIGAAVLFLGPLTLAPAVALHVGLGGSRRVPGLAAHMRTATAAAGAGALLIPTIGLVNGSRQGLLGELWIGLALALFVTAGVVVAVATLPGLDRLAVLEQVLEEAESADGATAPPGTAAEVMRRVPAVRRRLKMSAFAVPALWLTILTLMVTKPV